MIIKSEPADAEVCIKGRSKSEYFSNTKSCVGTTPFEAEKVQVLDPDGEKRVVKFKDVEGDKESFYVTVSRQGYATQALNVPEWEHNVVLKPEGVGAVASPTTQVIIPASMTAPVQQAAPVAQGSVKITSEPVGALVYINDSLKGNTPFTYQGPAGIVRLKLELSGFHTLEKAVTVEGDKNIDVNFKLLDAAAKSQ